MKQMKRIRTVIALAAVISLLAGFFALPAAAADTSGYAAEVLRLVNAERKKAGLAELGGTLAPLNAAANKRAQEIAAKFDHKRPNGSSCFTVLEEYNVSSAGSGENIAAGYAGPADVMAAWMKSAGHKANILGNYSKLGVGVYEKDGRLYWTQMFILERGATSAPGKPAPAWKAWPGWLQRLARVFLFGWIWMR